MLKVCCELIYFSSTNKYNAFFGDDIDNVSAYALPEYLFSWADYDNVEVCLLVIKTLFGIAYLPLLSYKIPYGGIELYTAYGYGGFFCIAKKCEFENLTKVIRENFYIIIDYLKLYGVVDLFIRNSPFMMNDIFLPSEYLCRDRQTVTVDLLKWKDVEFSDYITSKQKWAVRYSIRNELRVVSYKPSDLSKEQYRKFIYLYSETMRKNQANQYYYFSDELFFNHLKLNSRLNLFFVLFKDELIGGSLFLIDKEIVHYHFSAIDYEFSKYQPTDLLVYSAIQKFTKDGKKFLHLGGGRSSQLDDTLFRFKNRYGRIVNQYLISKIIINLDQYNSIKLKENLSSSNMFTIRDAMIEKNNHLHE